MAMMHLLIVGFVLVSALLFQPVHSSASVIGSCERRCGSSFDAPKPCSCDAACTQRGSCCTDYKRLCSSGAEIQLSRELSIAVEKMWEADTALRLTPGKDFDLNTQSYVSMSETQDRAPKPLFQNVSSTKLEADIFQTFDSLLDNYHAQIGIRESTSTTEYREVTNFLKAVYATPTFQAMKVYLQSKGLLPKADAGVDLRMRELWFLPYSQTNGVEDSSGFENVFLGELDGVVPRIGVVLGMHNWYRMHKLEQSGDLNYQGFRSTEHPQLVKAQIVWNESRKLGTSMFVGTSPAFDISLYTLCFLERMNQICHFGIDGSPVEIRALDMTSMGSGTTVRTAYPIV